MDLVYEYSGNNHGHDLEISLFTQIQIGLHTLLCPNCAHEIERYKEARNILRKDFFPPSQNLENSIMTRINLEQAIIEEQTKNLYAVPGHIPIRGWVIAGIVIIVSLVTAFFGLDFQNVASETGMSFMLPMGITMGIVLTTYGAFFIGSHLKELSERFGL